MAKVVLLSGSPKAEGNTKQVLDQCKMVIEQEGLEAEIISLSGKDIKGCVACYKCKGTGKCAIDDDLTEIADSIRDAEGFIVGAPVYFGTARGDVMNALQRIGMMSRGLDNFLSWKVGGPIAVARRGGVSASYQEMLMFYFINEMIVPGSNYWNIVFGKAPGDALKDEEGIETVKKFASNVVKLIKKIN
ncbi:Multimeric flavodoxin WrbA [Desulfonispora thiosulfatigenes DSM 11270]|uniref:Multimeric flavodoxin WrbA n=1 Tax=Desulfonispora thiosulfatigenes DSM 11270 TaxID=656914 RepID=A0A1W1VIB7_DESTI|nr:flavodoxin family protein [Desulfonispora thiosulfatigenes]SMB92791.1 Multimeric flavodoxin WrbA [Desulfonispora thiosulfatigenes DSM 11270]